MPLAEHVRMKAQFQECIDLLKTENSAHSEKILHLEKLRIKVRTCVHAYLHVCTRLSLVVLWDPWTAWLCVSMFDEMFSYVISCDVTTNKMVS